MPPGQADPAAEPHAARLTSFTRQDLAFDVVDGGPVDGEVVVLLHGFPERASCWDAVAARLQEAGLRTLAPDQRGYSRGARPRRRRDYRLDELVADVEALIDVVGRPVHLVAHDWGSIVGWLVAARHPAVRSLTSVSVPHPAAYLLSMLRRDQLGKSWYVGYFNLPGLPERAAASGRMAEEMRKGGMTEAELRVLRDEVVADGALPGGLGWYRAIGWSLLGARRVWRDRVQVPVTHVWSEGDVAVSRRSAELTARWAAGDYELRIIKGTHWLPEQEPDAVAEIALARIHRASGG